MRLLPRALTTLLLALTLDAAAAEPATFDVSTEAKLTETVARMLRKEAPEIRVSITQPLQLQVQTPKADVLGVNLTSLWQRCAQSKATCEPDAKNYVAETARIVRASTASSVSKSALRPALRPKEYIELAKGNGVSELFAGNLWTVYFVDGEGSARGLMTTDLATLGMGKGDVAKVALANLEHELGPLADSIRTPKCGTSGQIVRGQYYESSQLLRFDAWRELAAKLGCSVAVAVPEASVVLYAFGVESEIVPKLAKTARAGVARAERPLSDQVLVWNGNAWRVANK